MIMFNYSFNNFMMANIAAIKQKIAQLMYTGLKSLP